MELIILASSGSLGGGIAHGKSVSWSLEQHRRTRLWVMWVSPLLLPQPFLWLLPLLIIIHSDNVCLKSQVPREEGREACYEHTRSKPFTLLSGWQMLVLKGTLEVKSPAFLSLYLFFRTTKLSARFVATEYQKVGQLLTSMCLLVQRDGFMSWKH